MKKIIVSLVIVLMAMVVSVEAKYGYYPSTGIYKAKMAVNEESWSDMYLDQACDYNRLYLSGEKETFREEEVIFSQRKNLTISGKIDVSFPEKEPEYVGSTTITWPRYASVRDFAENNSPIRQYGYIPLWQVFRSIIKRCKLF